MLLYFVSLFGLEGMAAIAMELYYIAELRRWSCCERRQDTPPQRDKHLYVAIGIGIAVLITLAAIV